jgi:hypothetical protein
MSPRAEDPGLSRATDLADAVVAYEVQESHIPVMQVQECGFPEPLVSHTATITAPGATSTVVDSTEVARRQADGRWLYAIDAPFFAPPPAGRVHPTS